MAEEQATSRPILVGVNNSPEARAAATYAAELADPCGGLLLAHAYWTPKGPLDVAGRSMIGELETAARSLVDGLAADLRQTCSAPVTTTIEAAEPVPFLSRLGTRRPSSSARTPQPCSTG